MKCPIKKAICLVLAFLFLILGFIGALLPILPTTPFLLVSSFFFARGSERFNKWFLSTKLYKKHLEDFAKSRTMPGETKVKILFIATTMLLISIYFANNIYARISIICIMVYKYYYFIFKIKTTNLKNRSKKTNKTDN